MLKHAKANQHNYKSSMHEIKKDYPKNVKITNKELDIIKKLWKSREVVIKCFCPYSSMVSEAKHESTKGEGLQNINF